MTPDLRSLPPFARSAFEQVFGTPQRQAATDEHAPEVPRSEPTPNGAGVPPFAQAPRGFTVQPVQALLALAGILFLLVAARPSPGGAAAAPGIGPGAVRSVAGAGSARSVPATDLLSALEDLHLRAAIVVRRLELADRRLLAMDAARALEATCPVGVEWLSVASNEVKGRCRRGPSVGAFPVPSPMSARLQASARSSTPQPGAIAESGGAGSLGGGSR